MGLSDGNPSYGSVTCYITSQLRPGRPLKGLPSVGVYTCMYLRMYIHGCICMRVCGWDWVSCMDYRVYIGEKRVQDRYSEMDVCDQRLGLCKDLREQSINDIKCATC